MSVLLSPFPYFGGKRSVAGEVWRRLGTPAQYIEPFCGSAAVLLAARRPAALEVICDGSGFVANFWRAVKHQPAAVAEAADYPVSHIDLGAAHVWLMGQRERVGSELQDIEWPGDAKAAGRWLHGQCCWIGSGWCEWNRASPAHTTSAGLGIHALGQVPHTTSAGLGIHALGQIPFLTENGAKIQSGANNARFGNLDDATCHLLTSAGRTAWRWLHRLAHRLDRVRIVHGDWTRCLNNNFGGSDTALFLDPPYRSYERLYGEAAPVADAAEAWARDNADLRIALCGHIGDYDLPGWDVVEWSRGRPTYGGGKTTDKECVWYSPACLPRVTYDLFAVAT